MNSLPNHYTISNHLLINCSTHFKERDQEEEKKRKITDLKNFLFFI